MSNIKLQSSDGEIFEVDVKIAKASVTIKTMLECLGMDDNDQEPVLLRNVSADILRKVIEWVTYHRQPRAGDEYSERMTDDISEWDINFLNVDQGTLFELTRAANYLEIKGLLDVTCKTIANMIRGRSPGEIRRTFRLTNNFDPVRLVGE